MAARSFFDDLTARPQSPKPCWHSLGHACTHLHHAPLLNDFPAGCPCHMSCIQWRCRDKPCECVCAGEIGGRCSTEGWSSLQPTWIRPCLPPVCARSPHRPHLHLTVGMMRIGAPVLIWKRVFSISRGWMETPSTTPLTAPARNTPPSFELMASNCFTQKSANF